MSGKKEGFNKTCCTSLLAAFLEGRMNKLWAISKAKCRATRRLSYYVLYRVSDENRPLSRILGLRIRSPFFNRTNVRWFGVENALRLPLTFVTLLYEVFAMFLGSPILLRVEFLRSFFAVGLRQNVFSYASSLELGIANT